MKKIGKEFINGTQYPDYSTVDLVLRVPEPPHELPVREGQTVIKLPNPKRFKVTDIPVRKAIESWEPVGFFSRSIDNLKGTLVPALVHPGVQEDRGRDHPAPQYSVKRFRATRWKPTLW